MNKAFKSLRTKLFLWYIGSLTLLTVFFFLVVHFLALPYGTDVFFIIFFILAFIGFIIIYKITSSLTYLSSRMKLISRKNLEERITGVKGEDEISELAHTFNNLLDRLNDAFKREQQFIADVAHELKTPLSTLRGSLEIALSKDRSKEEYTTVLEESLKDINHITSTLKNVLDLAWSETPNEQKKADKFNVSELIHELSEISQKMALKKQITIKDSIQRDIFISGFKDKLARAILNLIDNAIKYTPDKGTVQLELAKHYNKVVLTIKDNGVGISNQDIPHIFDRFYRGSATDKVFGSGLGLAIAKSIVNLHHGSIEVESAAGKGTTFIITFHI